MMLSARALLDEHPFPTRDQIRSALAGNLCRCTGYTQIFQAVELVAAEAAGVEPRAAAWQLQPRSTGANGASDANGSEGT